MFHWISKMERNTRVCCFIGLSGLATSRVNEVELNQIKSNQIKSNQVFQDAFWGKDTFAWFQMVSIFSFFWNGWLCCQICVRLSDYVTWLMFNVFLNTLSIFDFWKETYIQWTRLHRKIKIIINLNANTRAGGGGGGSWTMTHDVHRSSEKRCHELSSPFHLTAPTSFPFYFAMFACVLRSVLLWFSVVEHVVPVVNQARESYLSLSYLCSTAPKAAASKMTIQLTQHLSKIVSP